MNLCLLCNASPLEISRAEDGQVWVNSVHVLGKIFDVDSGTLSVVTSSSLASNPYCSKCTKKVKQLSQLHDQLEKLQKRIGVFQKEIGQSIVQSFPATANRGALYQWKRQIFEKLTRQGRTKGGNNEPVEIAIYSGSGSWTELATTIHLTNYAGQDSNAQPASSPEYFHGDDASNLIGEEITIPSACKSPAKCSKTKTVKVNSVRGDELRRDVTKNHKTRCDFCSREFSSPLNLSRHITIHLDDKPYSCPYCERTFRDSSNKARHVRNVHNRSISGTHYCGLCDKAFANKDSLYDHNRYKHLGFQKWGKEKIPSECRICGKVMVNRKNLLYHIRVQHELQFKTHYCSICGKPMKHSRDILQHQETHKSLWERELEGKTYFYKCSACTQSFPSKAKLQDHQSFEHPEVTFLPITELESKPHTCKYCSDQPSFTQMKELRAHIAAEHPSVPRKIVQERRPPNNTKPHACQICSKPCKDKWAAKQHELTHDPERNARFPFACAKCPPISGLFSKKEDFITHYETKHPKCSIPEVAPRNVKKHPDRFICEVCPDKRAFTSRKGLNEHIAKGHPKRRGPSNQRSATKRKYSKELGSSGSEEEESDPEARQQSRRRSRRIPIKTDGVKLEVLSSEYEYGSANEHSRDVNEQKPTLAGLVDAQRNLVVIIPRIDEKTPKPKS